MNSQELFEYHKHNSTYISEHVKFSDQKAGVALTVCLALTGFFGLQLKKCGLSDMNLWDFGVLLGMLLLLISAYFLLWRVLWPRYVKNHSIYLSWGGIGAFQDGQSYGTHLSQVSLTQFISDFSIQNYELAKVCTKKYDNLRIAFIFLSSGAALATVCWFFGLK